MKTTTWTALVEVLIPAGIEGQAQTKGGFANVAALAASKHAVRQLVTLELTRMGVEPVEVKEIATLEEGLRARPRERTCCPWLSSCLPIAPWFSATSIPIR